MALGPAANKMQNSNNTTSSTEANMDTHYVGLLDHTEIHGCIDLMALQETKEKVQTFSSVDRHPRNATI